MSADKPSAQARFCSSRLLSGWSCCASREQDGFARCRESLRPIAWQGRWQRTRQPSSLRNTLRSLLMQEFQDILPWRTRRRLGTWGSPDLVEWEWGVPRKAGNKLRAWKGTVNYFVPSCTENQHPGYSQAISQEETQGLFPGDTRVAKAWASEKPGLIEDMDMAWR